MTKNYYVLKFSFTWVFTLVCVLLISCAGTHGYIIDYNFSTCKDTLDKYIHYLKKDSTIQVIDSTDDSGLNRVGYFDISIKEKDDIYLYKMFYYGGSDEYWKSHNDDCILSIIEINNKYDADLSFFSLEKRKGIKIFEKVIIPRLKDLPKCR